MLLHIFIEEGRYHHVRSSHTPAGRLIFVIKINRNVLIEILATQSIYLAVAVACEASSQLEEILAEAT